MVEDDKTRMALKAELFRKVEDLGLQRALFPSKEEQINGIVQQLEFINPLVRPIQPKYLPSLFGKWYLVYASQGTVVTRWFASILDWREAINIRQVWQTLAAGSNEKIAVENGAVVNFPLLGEWRLGAEGDWESDVDEQVAKVTFNTFSFQAIELFGQGSWSLPELKIPVLESLRNEALWTTSYLDQDMRVGRGATGNLFVFRRA